MEKLSFAQQTCVKKSGFALMQTRVLWPGARIGVAVSGGVDSFILAKIMKIRRSVLPFPVELMALHVNPGFDPANHAPLADWLAREGYAARIETGDFGPAAHSPQNRKNSPCFFCAAARRKRLFELCRKFGLTHLAFGHNADDLLTTFLLNFCHAGRAETLAPATNFFGGRLRVVRPLLFVEKKYIRQAARQWGLPVYANPCPSAGKTARSQADEVAEMINAKIPGARRSMLNALTRLSLTAINDDPPKPRP